MIHPLDEERERGKKDYRRSESLVVKLLVSSDVLSMLFLLAFSICFLYIISSGNLDVLC